MYLNQEQFNVFYKSKNHPVILEIPTMNYITIEGQGNPNEYPFQQAVEALYTIAYTIKMSYKKPNPPKGYYAYTVFPLEGLWDLFDKSKPSSDKSNYQYKLMIQQPDFVDEILFQSFKQESIKKNDNPRLYDVKFEKISDGLCCQMLHLGPYDDEPASFTIMESYVQNEGFYRLSKRHKEIYLSDPRKAEPSKMKTILRFEIKKIEVKP